jgi:hypothetical protein
MAGGRVPGSLGEGIAGGAIITPSDWLRPTAPTMSTQGPQLEPAEDAPPAAERPAAHGAEPTLFSPSDAIALNGPLTPESLVQLYQNLPVEFRDPATGSIDRVVCSPCIYTNMSPALPRRHPCPTAAANLRQRAERASMAATASSRCRTATGR